MHHNSLTLGTIRALVSVDAIALAHIAGATTGAVVGASGADTLCLCHGQSDRMGEQFIVVDGQEPFTGVQVLQQTDVHHH